MKVCHKIDGSSFGWRNELCAGHKNVLEEAKATSDAGKVTPLLHVIYCVFHLATNCYDNVGKMQ